MEHISVLLNELIESLNIKKDGIYIDMTLGGGGHASEVLKRIPSGKLIGIDRDEFAIKMATEKLKTFDNKIIIKNIFENFDKVLDELNIDKVDGIYMDLGVSSFQFDDIDRGFSYNNEARLDMRMDQKSSLDAYKVVNEFEENELYKIIRDYGEDNFAKNIAKHIVEYRKNKNIETTTELSEIIKNSIPARIRANQKHPAKRTFQAIRIYINDELGQLERVIDKAVDRLNIGARLSIISFHSLEDRIVKNKFKTLENPCTCPVGYPCVCHKVSKGRIITKKPIIPTTEEIENNSRAKSAKLRVFERK